MKVLHLKIDYETEPLCIHNKHPRFMWQLVSEKPDCMQTAYCLTVGAYSTGRIESSQSVGIRYDGPALEPEKHYGVSVTVWDNHGEEAGCTSFFETGVEDWAGAKWIGQGTDDLCFTPSMLGVFKVNYTLKIEEGSAKAGFYFAMDDERLMDRNLNIYGIENKAGEGYVYLETDISGLAQNGSAVLNIYRPGLTKVEFPYATDREYSDAGESVNSTAKIKPAFSMPIPGLTTANANEAHTYYVSMVLGALDIYLDEEDEAHRINQPDPNSPVPPMFRTASVPVNPYGTGSDYVNYTMLGKFGPMIPKGQNASVTDIVVRNYRRPNNVIYREGMDHSMNSQPILYKKFKVKNHIKTARLYITARGIYEAFLNGQRVADDWFNPGCTQYNKTHMYQAYDVVDLLTPGGNSVGIQLSEGWWMGNMSFEAQLWNYFGDRLSALAKLVIMYEDGSQETIITDESWKIITNGPVTFANFFQGQHYDMIREKELERFACADFEDSLLKTASEVIADETTTAAGTVTSFTFAGPKTEHMDFLHESKLIGQIGPAVRKVQEFVALSVNEIRPGMFIYDMGQNLAGVPSITIRDGKVGQQVRLRFAEILYPDLPEYQDLKEMLMIENLRAAVVTDLFTLRDGMQILEPHFTYHGYRYIEISGIDEPLPLEDVKAIALSSVGELSADYKTSNPAVNQLWQNITWSLRDNFLSIPTDCPQRNERMGWSGDLSVFSRSAVYMADAASFLRRHMMAVRDTQSEQGRFPDIAPIGNGFGGVLWESVGLTAAWESYLQYHDMDMLADEYPAMARYIDYLETRIDPTTGLLDEGPLGDWLGPEYSLNEPAFLWTVYHAYDLYVISRAAAILGYVEDATHYEAMFQEKKAEFHRIFVDPDTHRTVFSSEKAMLDNRHAPMMAPTSLPYPEKLASGKYLMDTQTSYAVPLALGIFEDSCKEDAANFLAEAVVRENFDNDNIRRPSYSLMTGFIGTAWISQALSQNGKAAHAYRLLQNDQYPSWLYPVQQGATTIWERLNSYTHENGFGGNNGMNSFNHYSFGAVAAWMCIHSLGIQREEEHPGFAEFTLSPEVDPTGQMTYAEGYVDTIYGRIVSRWKNTAEGYRYHFEIPANTRAHIILPGIEKTLGSGKYDF